MLIALVLLTWSSAGTLVSLSEEIGAVLSRLSVSKWYRVIGSVESSLSTTHEELKDGLVSFDLASLPSNLSDRVATAFGIRAKKGKTDRASTRNTFLSIEERI